MLVFVPRLLLSLIASVDFTYAIRSLSPTPDGCTGDFCVDILKGKVEYLYAHYAPPFAVHPSVSLRAARIMRRVELSQSGGTTTNYHAAREPVGHRRPDRDLQCHGDRFSSSGVPVAEKRHRDRRGDRRELHDAADDDQRQRFNLYGHGEQSNRPRDKSGRHAHGECGGSRHGCRNLQIRYDAYGAEPHRDSAYPLDFQFSDVRLAAQPNGRRTGGCPAALPFRANGVRDLAQRRLRRDRARFRLWL